MKLFSWNILHIMHEINYVGPESLVITTYPNEQDRFIAIVKLILDEYNNHEQIVINLQEVSGDYLNKFKELFGKNVFYHTYDRIPTFKNAFQPKVYDDSSESLVTIVRGLNVVDTNVINFEKGKSALVLNFDNDTTVYNVHMPFKWANSVKIETDKYVYVTGDFNCDDSEVLSQYPTCYVFKNDFKTFITRRNGVTITEKYDHILSNKNVSNNVHVTKTDLSDHFPVSCFV